MKLKHIASITTGHPFRGKIPEVPGSGLLAIQMKDVSVRDGIHWQGCIETEQLGKREPALLQVGDILFIARGSNNFAVLVDDNLKDRSAIAAPHFYVIRCTTPDLLPEYIVWLLNQKYCQRYFQREAEGSFTKSIRRSVLEEAPIAKPSISIQRNIIQLSTALKMKQHIFEELMRNGETLMSAIANDLLNETNIYIGAEKI